MNISKWGALLALAVALAGTAAACGSSHPPSTFTTDEDAGCTSGPCVPTDATIPTGDDGPSLVPDDGAISNEAGALLTITPADITITVNAGTGQPIPTQQYTALQAGSQVGAAWTIDRGEIGSIGVS